MSDGKIEVKGTVFTSTEGDGNRVQIAIWEKHAVGEPGAVMRHELSFYEMQHLHELLTRALWWQVRNLV